MWAGAPAREDSGIEHELPPGTKRMTTNQSINPPPTPKFPAPLLSSPLHRVGQGASASSIYLYPPRIISITRRPCPLVSQPAAW